MKNVFQVLLVVAVIVLAYLVWDSPNQKIRFDKEKEQREEAIVERLIDIRTAQVAFKDKYKRYTGSLDTLIDFVKNDSTPIVYKEGFLSDSAREAGMTEEKAVMLGILVRDTTLVPTYTEIYPEGFVVDSIQFVPEEGGLKFEMEAGIFTTSTNNEIKVFEARVPYEGYLGDMDQQEIKNLIVFANKYERYPGLKVGSIIEANNNAGNWE